MHNKHAVMLFAAASLALASPSDASASPCPTEELRGNISWCCDGRNNARDRDRILRNLKKWRDAGRPAEGTTEAGNYMYEIRDGYKRCQGHNDHARNLNCTASEITAAADSADYCR